jgi:hypothetical protein
VSIHKWSFCPISALCSKNNPRNIKYMPVVIFFTCLDLEQKSSSVDGHYIVSGMVKIAVYTDGISIPFLFHILRCQVSGVRNDEQRRWYPTPETWHAGRNKYGIFFKAILWSILIIPAFMGVHTRLTRKAADCKNELFPVGNYSISQLLISLFLSSPSGTPSAPYEIMS